MQNELIHRGKIAKLIEGSNKYIREDGVVIWKYKSKEGYRETIGSLQKGKYRNTTINGKQVSIHRLVAKAFLPNPDNLPVVDHRDEDKHNNNSWNLRWCTAKQNSHYYHNLPGRIEKQEFMQEQTTITRALEAKVVEMAVVIETLQAANDVLLNDLHVLQLSKLAGVEEFEEYKKTEEVKIALLNSNYVGYKDTTGIKFANTAAIVEATGKKIVVGGVGYPSAGSAAAYITAEEALIGNTRTKATISKELRRFLQGKRGQWEMYGKYTIGY